MNKSWQIDKSMNLFANQMTLFSSTFSTPCIIRRGDIARENLTGSNRIRSQIYLAKARGEGGDLMRYI